MVKSITPRLGSATSILTFEKHLEALFEPDEDNNEDQGNEGMSLNRIDQLRAIVYKTLTHLQNIISILFYLWTILVLSLSVFIMLARTSPAFQITPTECHYCDESVGIKLDESFTFAR